MEEHEPWLRQEGEPENHYAWFHVYLMLGEGRNLLAAYNQVQQQKGPRKRQKAQEGPDRPTKTAKLAECLPGSWKAIIREWNWVERARAWDEHQQHLAEQEWEERYTQINEEGYGLSQQMVERAKVMLSWPLSKTTKSKDGKTVIIEPVEWTMHHAMRMAKEGTTLGRLVCESQAQRVSREVDGMDRDALMANVIRNLEAEGYEVRRRDERLMEEEEEDDFTPNPAGFRSEPNVEKMPTLLQAVDMLREIGYLVVPPVTQVAPVKKARDG